MVSPGALSFLALLPSQTVQTQLSVSFGDLLGSSSDDGPMLSNGSYQLF